MPLPETDAERATVFDDPNEAIVAVVKGARSEALLDSLVILTHRIHVAKEEGHANLGDLRAQRLAVKMELLYRASTEKRWL